MKKRPQNPQDRTFSKPAANLHLIENALVPCHSIIAISRRGVDELKPEDISPSNVGYKAFGLSCLPAEWVPSFFVVTVSSLEGLASNKTLDVKVAKACSRVGIRSTAIVIVRSSGTLETISHRGRLISVTCSADQVTPTIRKLIKRLPRLSNGKVHWIVQEYTAP